MAESFSTESLDYWRKFFNCANADIFQVIKYSILVASVDFPTEFLASRDQITEILYTCWRMQCSDSDRVELQTPEGVVEDNDDETSEGTQKESKDSKRSVSEEENEPTVSNGLSTSNRPGCLKLDEFEALTDEIEEQQETLGEVLRIKDVLANWKEESEKVLSESLRRLQLMELSVETLSATDIGRAVSGLHKHKSKPIRLLARTLIKGWKLLVEEWVDAAAAPTQEASPVSVNPSPAEEESLLPLELDFPPLDMGALLATQTASFEFSKFFDGMDEDGNPTSTKELKENGRRPRSKDNGDIKRQEVAVREPKPSTHNGSKDNEGPSCRVPEKPSAKVTTSRNREQRESHSGEVRSQELARKPPKPQDSVRKTSKGQDIPCASVPMRPPARAAAQRNTQQQRQKPSGVPTKPCPRRDVSKESEDLLYQRKLEVAKRKLQDRYEEAKNAKKQRTIQVMELKDLPKQGQSQNRHPQQLKGRSGNYFKRSVNTRSR